MEWRKVARERIDERKKIKSFQDQTMNKKVIWNSSMKNNSKTLRMTCAFLGERYVATQTDKRLRRSRVICTELQDFLLK